MRNKITLSTLDLDPKPLDEYERETMEALDKAMDEGTLVSGLTPERQAELQDAARTTMEGLAAAERGEGKPVATARQKMDQFFTRLTSAHES